MRRLGLLAVVGAGGSDTVMVRFGEGGPYGITGCAVELAGGNTGRRAALEPGAAVAGAKQPSRQSLRLDGRSDLVRWGKGDWIRSQDIGRACPAGALLLGAVGTEEDIER